MVENSFILKEVFFLFYTLHVHYHRLHAPKWKNNNNKFQREHLFFCRLFFWYILLCVWLWVFSVLQLVTLLCRFSFCELTKAQTKKNNISLCEPKRNSKDFASFSLSFSLPLHEVKENSIYTLTQNHYVHHLCYRFNVSFFYLCLSLSQNVFCISTYSSSWFINA